MKLNFSGERPFVIKPRNAGQLFMREALMMSSDDAPLVIVKGAAGTAKMPFSLAVGLEKAMSKKTIYKEWLETFLVNCFFIRT